MTGLLRFLRNTLAGGAVSVLAGLAFPTPVISATFGLVVGIDDYVNLPPLAGAVNDAEDIRRALEQAGAVRVHTLLDRAATREAILAAWQDIITEASPGDTVVFSYAGHGGQEPERIKGSESDRLDETFQLAGFHTGPSGNGQRIVDDEIHKLFVNARHLKIIFVADSCHSGTATRGFDPRAGKLRTRLGGYGKIVDDKLPPPDPSSAAINREQLDNVIFFGAVQDHELAMEVPIDGEARGALSWSFANAIRGKADGNRDGIINTRELENYLVESVRTVSEGRQFPQMAPRGRPTEIAFQVGKKGLGRVDNEPVDGNRKGLLGLRVVGVNDGSDIYSGLNSVYRAEEGRADLTWDYGVGDVVNATGDVVARLGARARASDIQGLVDKWLLLRDLRNMSDVDPLRLRITPDHSAHEAGSQVSVTLDGHKYPRLTVFNLGTDGTVQFLIPWPPSPDSRYHGKADVGQTFDLPFCIREPFGADHLVVVSSPDGLPGLDRRLDGLHDRKVAALLRRELPDLLKGYKFQVGTVGLFTTPGAGSKKCRY